MFARNIQCFRGQKYNHFRKNREIIYFDKFIHLLCTLYLYNKNTICLVLLNIILCLIVFK
jgi:hypothetical protein